MENSKHIIYGQASQKAVDPVIADTLGSCGGSVQGGLRAIEDFLEKPQYIQDGHTTCPGQIRIHRTHTAKITLMSCIDELTCCVHALRMRLLTG